MTIEELNNISITLGSFYKKSEQGRSMVEMLGVLAVIGVLSVGGIYGYRIAISKHKANEAAQLVSIAGVEIMANSVQEKQASTVVDFPANSPVSLQTVGGKAKAGIKVDFEDDISACKQFAQMYANSSEYAVINNCED